MVSFGPLPDNAHLCPTHDRLGMCAWSITETLVYCADRVTRYVGRQLLPVIGEPELYASVGATTVTVYAGRLGEPESDTRVALHVLVLSAAVRGTRIDMVVYRQRGTMYVARCMLYNGTYCVYIETGGGWSYHTTRSAYPICLHVCHTIDHETVLYLLYRLDAGVGVCHVYDRMCSALELLECTMSRETELESCYVGSGNMLYVTVCTNEVRSMYALLLTMTLQPQHPVLELRDFVVSDQVYQFALTDVSAARLGSYRAVRFTSSGQACCIDKNQTLIVLGRPVYVPPPLTGDVFLTLDGRLVYTPQDNAVRLSQQMRYMFSEPGRLFVASPSTYRDMYAIRDFMPHSGSFFQEVERTSIASVRAMAQIRAYCDTPYAQGDVSCACLNNQQLIRSTFGLADDVVVETSPYAALVSVAPCYAEKCVSIRGQQPPTYISAFLSQTECPQMITVCSMLNSGSVGGHAISMCGNIGTNPKIDPVPKPEGPAVPAVPAVPAANGLATGWIVGIIVACVGVVMGVGIYWRRRTKVAPVLKDHRFLSS